jgi:aminopeptidase N
VLEIKIIRAPNKGFFLNMSNRIYLVLFLLFGQLALAQNYLDESLTCFDAKSRMSDAHLRKGKLAFPGDGNIDVNYYFLDIKINPSSRQLTGAVQIDFTPIKENLNLVSFDLSDAFVVDSIISKGEKLIFKHQSNLLTVSFPEALTLESAPSSVKIYYSGRPPNSNETIGLQFTTHGNNVPVIWTLSEPYDAPLWWPCVDNPADKADSCDVWITLPLFYTAVSQGKLTELKHNEDGTNTAKWKHRYPISHYLISIAASNYVLQKQEWKHSEGNKMDVLNYLYPEVAADIRFQPLLESTLDMLTVFSEVYGEYPFIKEKYGHAMFGFGGGMEHQTVSSMGGFNTGLIAHELAHQWFGDKVTCKTWRDIWVNEGFAEFSSLYYYEKAFGKSEYQARVLSHMTGAKKARGTVAIENTNSVDEIFNFARTYQKGSIILHMLRGVLGDEVFFKSLKEYQTTEFAYDAATIKDFKKVTERVSGLDLSYFFDQWIFGTGFPVFSYSWMQSSDKKLTINVKHQGSGNTSLFKMPVEIQINFEDGTNEIEKVFVNENNITFQLDKITSTIKSIVFDPNNLIMKNLTEVSFDGPLSSREDLEFKLFPNPTQELIHISNGMYGEYNAEIYDLNGKNYGTFRNVSEGINIKNLPSGRFFIHLKDENGFIISKPFIKN